jgi:hypothetical protein
MSEDTQARLLELERKIEELLDRLREQARQIEAIEQRLQSSVQG